MKNITLHYFAVFREQAGRASESHETDAATLAALYAELRARHAFTLDPEFVRVAIGSSYAEMDAPVPDGAEITFVPPVAGG